MMKRLEGWLGLRLSWAGPVVVAASALLIVGSGCSSGSSPSESRTPVASSGDRSLHFAEGRVAHPIRCSFPEAGAARRSSLAPIPPGETPAELADLAPPADLPPTEERHVAAAQTVARQAETARQAGPELVGPPAPTSTLTAASLVRNADGNATVSSPLAPAPAGAGDSLAGQPRRPPEPVVYRVGGSRDPFRTLITEEVEDLFLLDLEGARLVGIASNDEQVLAMLEDQRNRNFALRPGDRVRSGRLVSVTSDKAIFDLWIYGKAERRVLQISREEEK